MFEEYCIPAAAASDRPYMNDDEAAVKFRADANSLACGQIRADMRRYVVDHPRASLGDWALVSKWAEGTGGDLDELTGVPLRVTGGTWRRIWDEVQATEEPILLRLCQAEDAHRQVAEQAKALATRAGRCAAIEAELEAEQATSRRLRLDAAKMQERLHAVLQARKDEQAAEKALIDQQHQEMERLGAELVAALEANEHIQKEYDQLKKEADLSAERASHFESRLKQLSAVVANPQARNKA